MAGENEAMADEQVALREYLAKVFEPHVVDVVLSYMLKRCTLCDEGTGVLVKDGGGEWQIWCLTCSLQLLPDDTWISPVTGPGAHSLSQNSSWSR
jgi:hypothetical protein